MEVTLERPNDKYGSVISAALTERDDIEVLTVKAAQYSVASVYKPPDAEFSIAEPSNFSDHSINFVMGDFNCHSQAWGYNETDDQGENLEI